jgi:hypothetical protein
MPKAARQYNGDKRRAVPPRPLLLEVSIISFDNFRNEITVHFGLKHPNVVQAVAFSLSRDNVLLASELMLGVSLYDALQRTRKIVSRYYGKYCVEGTHDRHPADQSRVIKP